MDRETKLWLEVLFLSVTCMQLCVHGVPQVPCHFIFGDSLSDCGNNNGLSTKAKVNYLPYGIDFPAGPTGRFTNGLTEADFITQLLGFKNLIPPFANLSGLDILEGVNYASGSAGIRDETGSRLGENFSLEKQVQNHRVIASQIASKLGSIDKAQQHLNKCLYYMNIGSNDYINNYEQPDYYPTQSLFTPEQYAAVLIQQYSVQLRALYAIGARRFALIGMMRLGCTPREISIHGKNGTLCDEKDNDYSLLFNSNLRTLVDRLNREIIGAKFIIVNSAAIATGDEIYYCCQVDDKIGLCLPNSVPCNDRSQFKYFDAVHPSEKVNQVTATNAYKSPSPAYTYPMDISQLISIQLSS